MLPQKTVASPNYREEELKKRTDALWEANGPWEQLVQAEKEIVRLVRHNFYSAEGYAGAPLDRNYEDIPPHDWTTFVPRPCYKSHLAGVSMDDVGNLLFGHDGLSGELWNGPAVVELLVHGGRQHPERALSPQEIATRFVERWSRHSQLTKPARQQATQPLLAAMGFPDRQQDEVIETSRQGLFRCADEVEKWVSVNAQVIPAVDQQRFTKELYAYRAALTEVCNYVDYAEGYLAHHQGQSKIHTGQQDVDNLPSH